MQLRLLCLHMKVNNIGLCRYWLKSSAKIQDISNYCRYFSYKKFSSGSPPHSAVVTALAIWSRGPIFLYSVNVTSSYIIINNLGWTGNDRIKIWKKSTHHKSLSKTRRVTTSKCVIGIIFLESDLQEIVQSDTRESDVF